MAARRLAIHLVLYEHTRIPVRAVCGRCPPRHKTGSMKRITCQRCKAYVRDMLHREHRSKVRQLLAELQQIKGVIEAALFVAQQEGRA